MNCYDPILEPIYKKLGIDTKKLFCTMANVEWSDRQKKLFEAMLSKAKPYTSTEKKWINGMAYDKDHVHVTLLYGQLNDVSSDMISAVLKDWEPQPLQVEEISFFPSPDKEEYYCIIAKLKLSDNLMDAHNRLQLLPHVNTFPGYKAHITLGYIQKDEAVLKDILKAGKLIAQEYLTCPITQVVYDNNSGDPTIIK